MKHRRFIVAPEAISGKEIRITGGDAYQIKNVLRLKPGDTLSATDGKRCCEAVIVKMGRDRIVARITEQKSSRDLGFPLPCGGEDTGEGVLPWHSNRSNLKIVLLQAVLKAGRMDWLVEKATELGVARIVPVICSRNVVKPSSRKQRWMRIAKSAAKQSDRVSVPEISEVTKFSDALDEAKDKAFVIAWEEERDVGLKDVIKKRGLSHFLWIAVGPEGGFTKEEINLARSVGAKTVSLGPRLLRSETAALYMLAVIDAVMEGWNE